MFLYQLQPVLVNLNLKPKFEIPSRQMTAMYN